jgi:hypothetical protein
MPARRLRRVIVPLPSVGGQEGRVGLHVAKLEGFGEGRVAQGGADHAVFGKQAQIARRQLPQPLAPATGKVKRRPAVGDHQRHHLVQRAALGGQLRAAGFGRGEQLVGGVEIGANHTHRPSPRPLTSPCPGAADSGTVFR